MFFFGFYYREFLNMYRGEDSVEKECGRILKMGFGNFILIEL